eukprot:TRINITY_DN8989_c0_g1_i4.p1 TRINITY_DN8989_c0_g1~~TRINITY_DN8989_c0_g1_i4.p1  ORF type:complete len:483 (-),score=70.17 TRINITY_DN8989_c0_g1_i4:515-1759(-)
MDQMYARHSPTLLDLELDAFVRSNAFRVIAVDHDMVSFTDTRMGEYPLIVPTNPKNAAFLSAVEPFQRIGQSTHVRTIVISLTAVANVTYSINGGPTVQMQLTGENLYTAPWDAEPYVTGLHTIKIQASDVDGNSRNQEFQFSIDGTVAHIPLTAGSYLAHWYLPAVGFVCFFALFIWTVAFVLGASKLFMQHVEGKIPHWHAKMQLMALIEYFGYRKIASAAMSDCRDGAISPVSTSQARYHVIQSPSVTRTNSFTLASNVFLADSRPSPANPSGAEEYAHHSSTTTASSDDDAVLALQRSAHTQQGEVVNVRQNVEDEDSGLTVDQVLVPTQRQMERIYQWYNILLWQPQSTLWCYGQIKWKYWIPLVISSVWVSLGPWCFGTFADTIYCCGNRSQRCGVTDRSSGSIGFRW